MTDESFKYTLHTPLGDKEVIIGNMKDLYIFLNDKIDLEVCKLENLIEKKTKSALFHSVCYSLCGFTLIVMAVVLAVALGL
jgi:hypothetical protein